MSLLQMSFSGGVLILAVTVLRALALNRLPKGTFLALWAVAALRLLVPFTIPSPASVYTLAERVPVLESVQTAVQAPVPAGNPVFAAPLGPIASIGTPGAAVPAPAAPDANVWSLAWLAGMLACAGMFLLSYRRSRRMFRTACPVSEDWVPAWLARHRLLRPIAVRQSGKTNLPLTYGVLRPVILLPEEQREDARLEWVLEHEFIHIQRFDGLFKLVLAATACVHWFNPLVWVMLALANRDMELRCDETVVRRLGLERRGDYARALISMEEQKSGLGPFASAFNKSAIEERIIAIMKTKKRSLAAVLAAVALVCCVGAGFATSAAKNKAPYPWAQEGAFTKEELDRLASLWFEGYEDMTVADYQQKMWTERDMPEDIALIERYGQYSQLGSVFNDDEATKDLNAFYVYFYGAYEPLTAERWQERIFPGVVGTRLEDGSAVSLEYTCTLHILDPDTLTVGEYQQVQADIKAGVKALIGPADPAEDDFAVLSRRLSTDSLEVTVEAGLPIRSYAPVVDQETSVRVEIEGGNSYNDPDAELLAQFSREVAARWDETLAPYVPFGLTYQFDDPDYDGNGLTMWFDGKEVRGIYDEQEGIWITEHAGDGFSAGAVELYTVYTDGVLSGLREATPEEQAAFDEDRDRNAAKQQALLSEKTEQREFPQATREDYDSIMTLRTDGYEQMSLAAFNQRLLDWANENPDAWDRINCDVIWNERGVELSGDEWGFTAFTCLLSGRENAAMVRSLYLDTPEEDPHFSASMSDRTVKENGIVTAWCSLYYDISYHVADKSAATVEERDSCVVRMMSVINSFWKDTDADTLLQMTEEDIVARFNAFALVYSTENVRINPITADDIHFEAYDERGID